MRTQEKQYTSTEVLTNIKTLTSAQDSLKKERTALSQRITELKKQIEYWEQLDQSQLKAF